METDRRAGFARSRVASGSLMAARVKSIDGIQAGAAVNPHLLAIA
jgi:hypothetical protein